MRLTRAQAAAQAEAEAAHLSTDNHAVDETKSPGRPDRWPLGELAQNTIDVDNGAESDIAQPAAKGRMKTGKPSSVGSENHVDMAQPQDHGDTPTQVEDHNGHDGTEASQVVQTAIDEAEPSQSTSSPHEDFSVSLEPKPALHVQLAMIDPVRSASQEEELMSPSGEPAEIQLPPYRTLAKSLQVKEAIHVRSTSNKENEQPLSSTTPARAPLPTRTAPSSTTEVSAEHLEHELDERTTLVEAVSSDNTVTTRAVDAAESLGMPAHEPASPVADVQALSSSASSTDRKSSSKKPMLKSTTAQGHHSIKSNDVSKPESKTNKVAANIPHSKPRPMSMAFPAPPAPPKSSKAPTKSTFQLPGVAVAAKLKAAREARLNKDGAEAESQKRPAFKARPAPKVKDGPPPVVRETASSRARESLMLGKTNSQSTSATAPSGYKRPASARDSIIKGRPLADTARRVSTAPQIDIHAANIKPSTSSGSAAHRRPSSALIDRSQPRASLAQRNTSAGISKGKEVFQRAAVEQDALQKQKRDKEEAARKARAEAAERGRVASREWAEKMKLKALKAKGARHITDAELINAAAV